MPQPGRTHQIGVLGRARDRRAVLPRNIPVLFVVKQGEMSDEIRRNMELWVGCVAGALEVSEFEALLLEAGFSEPEFEPTRTYQVEDARTFLKDAGLDVETIAPHITGRLMAAFIRARKPE